MWWIFEKYKETEEYILYRYSKESEEKDGVIRVEKESGEYSIIQPCKIDYNSEKAQKRTLDHFYKIIKNNYPEHMQVACG